MRRFLLLFFLVTVLLLLVCSCESFLNLKMSSAKASKLRIEERDEDSKILFRYSIQNGSVGLTRATPTLIERVKGFSLRNAAKKTLLPIGYPASVPKEYTRYQGWNLVQVSVCVYVCIYIVSVIS